MDAETIPMALNTPAKKRTAISQKAPPSPDNTDISPRQAHVPNKATNANMGDLSVLIYTANNAPTK